VDPIWLSRLQFAMTIGFHYLFPPLTIGMAWVIVYLMTRYHKNGDEEWGRQARFWLRLFAITFGIGVATGLTMEFQFGTNWSEYSKMVGGIFGAPLAAEGLFAFFLESTFVGVLLFGWERFSSKMLWIVSILVAFGATLSVFWIIVANSWMQTPAGYKIVAGKAVLTDFWASVFNASTIPRYLHTVDAALITGALFVLGLSAMYLLKHKHEAFALRSAKVSLVFAALASVAQLPLGYYHAVQVARTQPEKFAAFEGLFETRKSAPLLLFGIPDEKEARTKAAVSVPGMLSFLVHFDRNKEVKGLKSFPRFWWPPVLLTFISFHLMFLLGLFFIGLTMLGLFLWWRGHLERNRFFWWIAALTVPLPFLANELGWMAAEVGRQPWIVYRVMLTARGASKVVPASQILGSIVLFGTIYLLLGAAWLYLIRQVWRQGPQMATEAAAATSRNAQGDDRSEDVG